MLEDTAGNTVSVFFVDAGQKTLSLKDLELVKVDGEEANHPILDNLKIVVDEGLRFRSLPESIQRFRLVYASQAGSQGDMMVLRLSARDRSDMIVCVRCQRPATAGCLQAEFDRL